MDNAFALILVASATLALSTWITRTRSPGDSLNFEAMRLQIESYERLQHDVERRDRLINKLREDIRRLSIYIDLIRDGWRACDPHAKIPPRPTLEANGDETPTGLDIGELQRKLAGRLSLDEWRDAAMQIDSRFDGEGYHTAAEFSENFLRYLGRHGRVPRLLRWLADHRKDIEV